MSSRRTNRDGARLKNSSDGATDGSVHVDFPAASPHPLACGGTSLQLDAAGTPREKVWNDGAGRGATGGGVSDTDNLISFMLK